MQGLEHRCPVSDKHRVLRKPRQRSGKHCRRTDLRLMASSLSIGNIGAQHSFDQQRECPLAAARACNLPGGGGKASLGASDLLAANLAARHPDRLSDLPLTPTATRSVLTRFAPKVHFYGAIEVSGCSQSWPENCFRLWAGRWATRRMPAGRWRRALPP